VAASAKSVEATAADSATREASSIVSSAMSVASTAGGSERSSALSVSVFLRPRSFLLQFFPPGLGSTLPRVSRVTNY